MSGLLRCNSAMAEGGVRLFLLLESAPFRRRSTDGTNFITGGRPQVIFHVNIRMVTERVSFGFPCCQHLSHPKRISIKKRRGPPRKAKPRRYSHLHLAGWTPPGTP